MRILWLCNIVLPRIAEHLGMESSNKEGWLTGMADRLCAEMKLNVPDGRTVKPNEELVFGVCFPVAKGQKAVQGQVDGLSYFAFHEDVLDAHHYDAQMEGELGQIVEQFKPDAVHIFGTEYPHTLAMLRAVPDPARVLVGIQGLCFVYADFYMADLPEKVINRFNFRDIVRRDTLRIQQKKYVARGAFEKEALRLCTHVTGRTAWDEKWTGEINPKRQYHVMGENLRATFYEGEWDVETCEPYRIFMSQGNYPIKGLHYVLPALAQLKKEFPQIKLCVAGDVITDHRTWKQKLKLSSYGKYLLELLERYELTGQVEFLGRQNAEQMKEQYLKCHVFLSPSAIENSPNSIGEALMLGVPVVSSDCGGVRSLFTEEQEGLFYPTADTGKLAACLRRIFTEPELAQKFHEKGRKRAREIHDAQKNYETLRQIYRQIEGEAHVQ